MDSTYELVIEPRKGWQPVDFRELWDYRELLGFLVWRDIKVRYKQTLLGGLWAILQPFIGMVVFGVLFQPRGWRYAATAPHIHFSFSRDLCSGPSFQTESVSRVTALLEARR